VRLFDRSQADVGLSSPHSTRGFQTADEPEQIRIHQVVEGGHRRSVGHEGVVADHHRVSGRVAHDDLETGGWLTAEKLCNPLAISCAGIPRRR